MATITVDGKVIEAPAGAPLVEVLKNNGFYVSNLCYVDGLKPYAGCRSCLVDIEGPPGLQLSCTAVVQDNMVVRTDTEEVKEGRRAVVSLILANHSDRCLTCHRREHCHPGDICLRDDIVTHRCLTCSKNYRCELQATCEMVGMSGYEPWVGEERSWYQSPQPAADRANPFMEFDPQMCIICTRCQRTCDEKRHTGAITLSLKGYETRIAFGAGGPIHDSNCDFSGACIDVCPTAALMEHPNKWVSKPQTWTMTVCDSCSVGCTLHMGAKDGRAVIVRPGESNPFAGDQVCVRGRYHYDSLRPDERLTRHQVRRGAILAPASLTEAAKEAAAALQAAKAKGRVGVMVGATATNEEAWIAARIARDAFGAEADSTLGPVLRAVNAALESRLGTWRMPAEMTALPRAKTIVVVADDLEESHNVASVRIKDAAVREKATLVVIGGLRSELVDFASCWLRPPGGEEGQMAAALAEAVAGVPGASQEVAAAAALLREAAKDSLLVVCAPNPVSPALAGAMAGGAANLAIALLGEGAADGLVVLPPGANANGLLDMGVGVSGGERPLEGLAGLLVFRDDPAGLLPGGALPADTVVIDGVLSATARGAAAVIAEGRAYASGGTYTAADWRVQRLAPAIVPGGEAVSGLAALLALGEALGLALPSSPEAVREEIARANPVYGPALDLAPGEGVRIPAGRRGKPAMVAVPAAEEHGEGLRVITGRDLYTASDAAAAGHAEADKLHRYDRFQVSEEDGARLGLRNGDTIEISGAGVMLTAPVTITERVPEGCVYVSSLLQGGAAAKLFAGSAIPRVRAGAPVRA